MSLYIQVCLFYTDRLFFFNSSLDDDACTSKVGPATGFFEPRKLDEILYICMYIYIYIYIHMYVLHMYIHARIHTSLSDFRPCSAGLSAEGVCRLYN